MDRRFFLPLLALLGCAPHYSQTYRVEIDSTFTVAEMADVMAALDSWEIATPADFTDRVIVSHQEIIDHVNANPHTPTAFLFRDTVVEDPACPSRGQGVLPPVASGMTFQSWNSDNATSCFNAALAHQYGVFRSTVAHELGHVLGLQHLPLDAKGNAPLMYVTVHQYPDAPECADVAEYSSVWGTSVPARCQ